jgi:hypothetical protein
MQMQSPIPSPSPVLSRGRSFQRSKASSCPSLFGQQASSSTRSRGLSFRGIPECECFPRMPPPRREDSSRWPLRFSSKGSSTTTVQKKHWSAFHKRFQSTPPGKLERIYRPGWSNTSDPIIFDRQAHEQQRRESANTPASHNVVVRLVHCMFFDCIGRSASTSSLENDHEDGDYEAWQMDALQRHSEIRNSRSFCNRWHRMEHDYSLTE